MDLSIEVGNTNHWGLPKQKYDKLLTIKKSNKTTLKKYPDFNTEWHLIRFLEARNWNIPKTQEMLDEYFKFRVDYDLEEVLSFDFTPFNDIIANNYNAGFCHTDKGGRPILYERVGESNTKVLLKSLSPRQIRYWYIRQLQRVLHIQFPICSARAGKRIDKMVLIYDFKGVNIMKIFDSDFKNFLKAMSQLGQDYYPEILHMLVMVNVSFIIKGVWNTVKYLLDKKTRDKIKIFSDNGRKTMLNYISEENLPDFMGGECTDDLREYPGPWKEELDASKERKEFFLKDRTPEYEYFYTEEERKLVSPPSTINTTISEDDWDEGDTSKGEIKTLMIKMKSMLFLP